jgi:hypothetical protein
MKKNPCNVKVKKVVAYHESAHAIAALVYNSSFEYIKTNDKKGGYMEGVRSSPLVDEIIAYSGVVCWTRFDIVSKEKILNTQCKQDGKIVKESIEWYSQATGKNKKDLRQFVKSQAEKLVKEHWREIEILGDLLYKWKKLEYGEVVLNMYRRGYEYLPA